MTDIDNRKRAEEKLGWDEEEFRQIPEAIPKGIHVLHTDGTVLYANQTVLNYLGFTLQDVRREDYRARVFHPEDLARVREECRKGLAGDVPFSGPVLKYHPGPRLPQPRKKLSKLR